MAEKTPHQPTAPAEQPDNVAAAIRELVREMRHQSPSDLDMLGLSPERQQSLVHQVPGRRYRILRCVGPSGATMLLEVVEGSTQTDRHGTGVRWSDYRYPPGMFRSVAHGGMVPDGMHVFKDADLNTELPDDATPPLSNLTTQYKEWRRVEFFLQDHRALIGRPVRAHFCVDPADLDRIAWGEAAKDAAE